MNFGFLWRVKASIYKEQYMNKVLFETGVAAGYNFIGAYDEEGYRIGEGGMFYIGGGAELPVVDVHVGATSSMSVIRPIMEVLANKD